jgi:hypothetical protein
LKRRFGGLAPGQDVEARGVAELRMLTLELLEDADGALGIDLPAAVLLDVAELAGRGVVEGQDEGCGALRQVDPAVEVVAEGHRAIAPFPQPLEIPTEVGRRAGPALLGMVDLVVLEDHDPAELVDGELGRPGRLREQRGREEGDRRDRPGQPQTLQGCGVAGDFFARVGFAGRRAAAV